MWTMQELNTLKKRLLRWQVDKVKRSQLWQGNNGLACKENVTGANLSTWLWIVHWAVRICDCIPTREQRGRATSVRSIAGMSRIQYSGPHTLQGFYSYEVPPADVFSILYATNLNTKYSETRGTLAKRMCIIFEWRMNQNLNLMPSKSTQSKQG